MVAEADVSVESERDNVSLVCEDNLEYMARIPDGMIKLVVTSPPYNLGKKYEVKVSLDDYVENQKRVIAECVRILHPTRVDLLASWQLRR